MLRYAKNPGRTQLKHWSGKPTPIMLLPHSSTLSMTAERTEYPDSLRDGTEESALPDLVANTHRQSLSVGLILIATALLLYFSVTGHASDEARFRFLVLTLLSSLVRIGAWVHFTFGYQPERQKLFHRTFLLTLGLGAICWGIACVLLMQGSDQVGRLITMLFACSIGPTGAYIYGAILAASMLSVLMLMIPPLAYFLWTGSASEVLIGFAAIFLLLQAAVGSNRIRHLNLRALRLAKTAHNAAQEAIRARAQAENAKQAESRFLQSVSHELRTPLNAIIGCGYLLESGSIDSAEQKDNIDTLNQAGQFMLGMINDLLDVSKINSGEFELSNEPFALDDSLKAVANVMRVNAKKKGINLVIEPMPADLTGYYLGDSLRLRQILFNLIGNAIKFTEKGSVRLQVSHAQAIQDRVERIRFDVVDTGAGIAKEHLDKLFKPFSQVGDIKQRAGGTGLGLSIVRELSERMGGQAIATSELGKGSTFSVEVELEPCPAPKSTAEQAVDADSEADLADIAGVRILLVDDSAMNRKVGERLLSRAGALVDTANDGQQALDWLSANPEAVDVVLLDVQMPVMDGIAAVKAIRADARFEGLPVVAMTAATTASDVDEGTAAGMDRYVPKPFEPATLFAVIRELVDAYRGPVREQSGSVASESSELSSSIKRANDPDVSSGFQWASLPGIDLKEAQARFRMEPGRYQTALKSFIVQGATVPTAYRLADNALRQRAFKSSISSLQTMATLVGAQGVSSSCRAILQLIQHHGVERAEREIDELLVQLNAMRSAYSALEREIHDRVDAAPSAALAFVDNVALRQFREKLKANSFMAVDAYADIMPALNTALGKDKTAILSKAMAELDFEAALSELDRLFASDSD